METDKDGHSRDNQRYLGNPAYPKFQKMSVETDEDKGPLVT